MPVTNCGIVVPAAANRWFVSNISALVGTISRSVVVTSPFASILPVGTWTLGLSSVHQTVSQGRAYNPNENLNFPAFEAAIGQCGRPAVTAVQAGKVIYNSTFGIKNIFGGGLCLEDGVDGFKGSIVAATNALRDHITRLIANDVRGNALYTISGTKVVCASGYALSDLVGGGQSDLSVAAPLPSGIIPDAELNWTALKAIAQLLRQDLGGGSFLFPGNNLRFIGGQGIVDRLRTEAHGSFSGTPQHQLIARVQGGDKSAVDELTSYAWEGTTYGIQFGTDQMPLRFDINADGQIEFVAPDSGVAGGGSTGEYAVVSPAYKAAYGEVAFLMSDMTIERQTRPSYTGEDIAKFQDQKLGAELAFVQSQGCDNPFGNYGELWARIGRAYVPRHPGLVIPILFKRCAEGNLFSTCSGESASASL
jgi:hypothetical protein